MKKILKILIVFILFSVSTFGYLEKFNWIDGYGLYLVQSDSMSPDIKKGSLLFSRSSEQYAIGDVITFAYPYDFNKLISHRVVGFSESYYITKGDANSDPDPWRIKESAIKGKAVFDIPYLGILLLFFRNPIGYVFSVLVFVAFIVSESNDLFLETLNWYKSIYRAIGFKLIKLRYWYKKI